MFPIALILYFLFLLCYTALTAALIYHVKKYTVPEDQLHTFIAPFVVCSLILVVISFYFFLQVPWNILVS